MNCQSRDDCRDVILNATVCIADCLRIAHVALGASRPDRATARLKEIDHYLYRIEGAVKACRSVGEGNGNTEGTDKASRRLAVDSIP